MFSRRSVSNGLSLYALQATRLLLPLVTIPYVTRVLGAGGYGEFAAGLNIVAYFAVLTTYGFELTGVRAVSLARGDRERARVFVEIVAAKCLLCVLSLLGIGTLVLTNAVSYKVSQVVGVLALHLVGSALHQGWWFQGIQQSHFLLVSNIVGYGVSTILVFALVRTPQDVLVYSCCYAIAGLLSGIIGLTLAGSRLRSHLLFPDVSAIFGQLRAGFPIFWTSFLSVLVAGYALTYMTFSDIPAESLGLYAGAYKVASVMVAFYAPLAKAWFPSASRRFSVDSGEGFRSARRFVVISTLGFAFFGLGVGLLAPTLLPFMFGPEFAGSEYVAYPLIAWAVVSVANNGLGVQILVSSGHSREYAAVFGLGALSIVILTPVGVSQSGAVGAAWAVLGAECILLAAILAQISSVHRRMRG